MKHLLTILSGLLVALLFARCADDDNLSGGIDGLPERGIVIRLSTGELDTRTQLTSTGDYHHVEEVWAVLYKLKDGADAETATEADFEYKTHEKLEWNPMTEDEYGEGNPQGKEFLLHTDGTVLTNGTYCVLCIGLDDRSGAVYSLRESLSDANQSGIFSDGKTLKDAWALIRSKESSGDPVPVGSQTSSLLNDPDNPDNTEDDQPEDLTSGSTISMNGDPATAELFAGWEEFVFEEDNINIVEVVLKRRVAGILCYLTDVPLKVNYDGKEQYVTGIRLCLASPAATSISLCRKEGNPTEIEDFGTLDENGRTIPFENLEGNKVTTLAYYQLPYEEQNYDITNTKETFQEGGETANYLMGVYMLPVKCTREEILFVQLMVQEEEPTSQGYDTGLYLPDGRYSLSMGQPGPKFIVKESNSGKKNFDIRPNYIYHIGNKDDDTDEPVSLLGQELLVEAKEWTRETIPVEFPSVPIKVTIENSDDFEGEILDCIGIETVLNIRNAVVHKDWYLTTTSEGVYFKQSDGTYDKSYYPSDGEKESSDIVPVTIVITDYAKYNDYKTTAVEDDKRQIDIQVMVGSEVQDKIEAEQWNAIIAEVYFGDNDKVDHYVGFSRYDRGPVQWGYNGDTDISILGANYNRDTKDLSGVYNYSQAESQSKEEKWLASAIYKGACDGVIYNSDTELTSESFWFLPAYYELGALLNSAWNVRNDEDAYNSYYLKARNGNSDYTNCYWSSSVVEARIYYAWAGYLDLNETHRDVDDFFTADKGNSEINERTRSYYLRPCKVITR